MENGSFFGGRRTQQDRWNEMSLLRVAAIQQVVAGSSFVVTWDDKKACAANCGDAQRVV